MPHMSDAYPGDIPRRNVNSVPSGPRPEGTTNREDPDQRMPNTLAYYGNNSRGPRRGDDLADMKAQSSITSTTANHRPDFQPKIDTGRNPVQRKQIGSSSVGHSEYDTSSAGMAKPLPVKPSQNQTIRQVTERDDTNIRPLDHYDPDRHASGDHRGRVTAEDVLQRAKGNTFDTEVIEKIAPGTLY